MSNVYPVEYAKTLGGKLIAVESGPYKGWAFGDEVFATKEEALAADGLSAQKAYLEDQLLEVDYGLSDMIDSHGPFAEWREKYGEYERRSDMVKDLVGYMFPTWGKRSDGAARFAAAFLVANAVYEELHGKLPA